MSFLAQNEGMHMKKILVILLTLCFFITLSGCVPSERPTEDNEDFNVLLDTLFLELLGDDPMDVNFKLLYPENYGLTSLTVEPFDFSKEAEDAYYALLESMIERLEAFNNKKLTTQQLLTKNILFDYINRELAFKYYEDFGSILGSRLGYQVQLPLILAEYRFDNKKDIEDYLTYLEITPINFASFIDYEKRRAEKNMGLIDPIIDRIIEQCIAFIGEEEHYMIALFDDKVEQLSFLSTLEKETFKALNRGFIENEFLGAYQYLIDELALLKGTATYDGPLAKILRGSAYYQVLFSQATGTNYTVYEAKTYLQTKLDSLMNRYQSNPNYYNQYMNTNLMGSKSLDDLIPFFREVMVLDFPELEVTLSHRIETVHEALQDHASPAMYFISPMDAMIEEVIYVNPKQFSEMNNYVYKTMAHEGFPGHLYQNVYMKSSSLHDVRKWINYKSYAEGWATYVENYVVSYVNPSVQPAFEFFDSINYIIFSIADIGVNYEGWTLSQLYAFLRTYFNIGYDDAREFYYDLIEMPTHYMTYYFSYYLIKDIKAEFKEQMGERYSDLLFHTIFLDTGSVPFDILREQYRSYKG